VLVSAAVDAHTATATSGRGHAAVAVAAVAASVALMAAIVVRWESGVVWAIALAAAAYAAGLEFGGGSLDEWAPLVAAGLVAAAELGQWAIELAPRAAFDAGILRRRAATIVAVAGTGAGAGWVILLASNAGSGSITLTATGLVAAAAAMVLVSRLARGT
jgi:hypothetical protein